PLHVRRRDRLDPSRAVDVLAGPVAVAAIDATAAPDPHYVPLADAALDLERDLGPPLGADRGFQEVLRQVVRQHPTLDLRRAARPPPPPPPPRAARQRQHQARRQDDNCLAHEHHPQIFVYFFLV